MYKRLFVLFMIGMVSGLFISIMWLDAHADEAFVGYGVGIFRGADQFLGQTKYAELGYRDFLYEGLYWQNKLGFVGEGSADTTRKSGGWASSGLGLETNLLPIELRGGAALAGITAPDSQLGGYFQFNEDISVGLRDTKGDGIALQYNHISCGSLCSPNLGRDAVILELSQKW
jgi:hypothetical protein